MVYLGEGSSSSGCLGWAALFYCDTPWAFHIIIIHVPYFANFIGVALKDMQARRECLIMPNAYVCMFVSAIGCTFSCPGILARMKNKLVLGQSDIL